MTKLLLEQKDETSFAVQTTKSNYTINIDDISPVEYFASSAAACSAVDIVNLPKDSGYCMSDLKIEIHYERNESPPKKLNSLHLYYQFTSDASDDQAKKWVMSSLETYCSTVNSLRSDVKIFYSISHNQQLIADNISIISGAGQHYYSASDAQDIGSCPI